MQPSDLKKNTGETGTMAINKSFESDESSSESSSEGSGELQNPEPSAPPLELAGDNEREVLLAPVVATLIPDRTGESKDAQATDNGDAVQSNQDHEQTRTNAAGIAAGVIGLFLGGPILALLAGGGTIYAAKQSDGTAGDAARAVGDVALTARSKAKELDEKHHVVDKTKVAAGNAWEKAKEMDVKHNFLDQMKNALAIVYERAVAFNEEHHVIDKVSNAMVTFFRFVSRKVAERNDNNNTQGH